MEEFVGVRRESAKGKVCMCVLLFAFLVSRVIAVR